MELPLEVVRNWFNIVAPYELLRRRARRVWDAARRRVLAAPRAARWRRVRGMVSGVIYVLDMAGWHAEGPFRWVSDEGVAYELPEAALREGEAIDVDDALGALASAFARRVWRQASAFWCGRGLESGC